MVAHYKKHGRGLWAASSGCYWKGGQQAWVKEEDTTLLLARGQLWHNLFAHKMPKGAIHVSVAESDRCPLRAAEDRVTPYNPGGRQLQLKSFYLHFSLVFICMSWALPQYTGTNFARLRRLDIVSRVRALTEQRMMQRPQWLTYVERAPPLELSNLHMRCRKVP